MGWTCQTRARSTPSICARSAKSWATTADACNNSSTKPRDGAKCPGSKMASVFHDIFTSITSRSLTNMEDCCAIIHSCSKFCQCPLIVAFTWNNGGRKCSAMLDIKEERFFTIQKQTITVSRDPLARRLITLKVFTYSRLVRND